MALPDIKHKSKNNGNKTCDSNLYIYGTYMLRSYMNHDKIKLEVQICTFRSPIPGQRASSSIEASMIRESDCKFQTPYS